MAASYRLTLELRRRLKKPLGTLIRGSSNETMKKVKDLVAEECPLKIISVGDIVSKNLVESKVFPQLSIVDNRVMRKRINPVALSADRIIRVKNPAGTITEEALTAIRKALKSESRVKIDVDGEEDLLALVAVLYAPEDSFILYGQPCEGVVAVKNTRKKKSEVTEILKTMKVVRKPK